jgi:hypothetical protein
VYRLSASRTATGRARRCTIAAATAAALTCAGAASAQA